MTVPLKCDRTGLRYTPPMSVSDLDEWRAANLLLKRHGRDVAIVAAQRADEHMAAGDVGGLAVWKRIVEAILELLRSEPDKGEHVN